MENKDSSRVDYVTAVERVRRVDFRPIVDYLGNRWNINWSAARAWTAARDFGIFFAMMDEVDFRMIPTSDIDEFWHACILHTTFYSEELCHSVFGRFIEHRPELGERGVCLGDQPRFERTAKFFEMKSGQTFESNRSS